MKIDVYKSQKLLVYTNEQGNQVTFPIGIGENEIGHKVNRSDMRTPEGEYTVCVKNNKSKFHLSLGLNYPNKTDALIGLENKIITQEEHDSILESYAKHGGSDWSTPLGGEIYIHGGLEDKPFSEGCVRMYNKDIEQVFEQIKIGSKVIIHK